MPLTLMIIVESFFLLFYGEILMNVFIGIELHFISDVEKLISTISSGIWIQSLFSVILMVSLQYIW